ncbi:LCP family protein [Streptomyces sp. NPDC051940]|uniref:LCP family protein n=1 Tax=Streptomyces sp. NPDC051940 TaxID=3155675 RepID=UPI003426EBEF
MRNEQRTDGRADETTTGIWPDDEETARGAADPVTEEEEEGGTGTGTEPAEPPARRSRLKLVLITALALLGLGVVLVAGSLWWMYDHYTGRVDRIPGVFPTNVPKSAQPAESAGGETYLLVGIDRRSDLPTTGSDAETAQWKPGAQRSDTMMLVHIPEDRDNAYVVSLPRDSWVDIPGRGKAKLNAAFSWGGPPLLIDTVQRLTKVKVDHLAVIDWSGFKKLTDAVGGVDITIPETTSRRNGGAEWTAGTHHMDGAEALDYVRERYGLPRGDLDRTQRQQEFLKQVLNKTLSAGNLTNPLKAKKLLDNITATVSVDDRLSDSDLRDLMWDMRGVRTNDMVFMNAPVAGFDMIQKQSVVVLDRKAMTPLWKAMRDDKMDVYVAKYPVDRLGDTAR